MATKRAALITKLDRVFSQYVRLRVCDEYGFADCFTCKTRRHWKEVDAGHFITRSKFATRWDPVNVQFQCKRCNMNGGHQYEFGRNLDATFGEGTAEELYLKSQHRAGYSNEDLQAMIALYSKELRELEGFVG